MAEVAIPEWVLTLVGRLTLENHDLRQLVAQMQAQQRAAQLAAGHSPEEG